VPPVQLNRRRHRGEEEIEIECGPFG